MNKKIIILDDTDIEEIQVLNIETGINDLIENFCKKRSRSWSRNFC